MTNENKAVLNFAYFSTNFPYKWEEKCFNGNTHMINKYRTSDMVPARFLLELSREYQLQMITWVQENYLAFHDFELE